MHVNFVDVCFIILVCRVLALVVSHTGGRSLLLKCRCSWKSCHKSNPVNPIELV